MWFLKEGHEGSVHQDILILQGLAREIFNRPFGLLFFLLILLLHSLIVKAYNDDYKLFFDFAYHALADTSSLSDRG